MAIAWLLASFVVSAFYAGAKHPTFRQSFAERSGLGTASICCCAGRCSSVTRLHGTPRVSWVHPSFWGDAAFLLGVHTPNVAIKKPLNSLVAER